MSLESLSAWLFSLLRCSQGWQARIEAISRNLCHCRHSELGFFFFFFFRSVALFEIYGH